MKNTKFLCFVTLTAGVILFQLPTVRAATISLIPNKDNSIYGESNNSNALGDMWLGKAFKAPNDIRRALLSFDIAGNIPAGATINSVTLDITQNRPGNTSSTTQFNLHSLNADWGEGSSLSFQGIGTSPTSGDATWNHRLFSTNFWSSPGGDFANTISGFTTLGLGFDALYTFSSQAGMVSDVQQWLNAPSSNHGWIIKANDENINSIREIYSRESSGNEPLLTVDFTPLPEPSTLTLLGIGSVLLALLRRFKNSK